MLARVMRCLSGGVRSRFWSRSRVTDSCLCVPGFSVVAELGRMALELLKRGASTKTYEGAASKTQHQHHGSTSLLASSSSDNRPAVGGRNGLGPVETGVSLSQRWSEAVSTLWSSLLPSCVQGSWRSLWTGCSGGWRA